MSRVDFSKVRPGVPGFFVTMKRGLDKGDSSGDGLSVTKVVSDGSGGLWVCENTGGVKIDDAEKKIKFLSEVSIDGAGKAVVNEGKSTVVDLLSTILSEGWPVFSRQEWARDKGYLENGALTKEGRLLYQEIAEVIKGLDESAEMPSIDDLA